MNFNTKQVEIPEVKAPVSGWIGYGLIKLAIKDAIIKTSQTGKIQTQLVVETESEPDLPTIEIDGLLSKVISTGKVGIIPMVDSWYTIADEHRIKECLRDFAIIAEELNVREQLDAITAEDWTSYVKAAINIIKNKYLWFSIQLKEEISSNNGKKVAKRTFSKFVTKEIDGSYTASLRCVNTEGAIYSKDPVTGVEKVINGKKYIQFDPRNEHDYKPLREQPKPDSMPAGESTSTTPLNSDLPF